MNRPILALALCMAGPLWAHPHEFVDASIGLTFNESGQLYEISVEWRYDPFTSMLILSDLGMNPAATDLTVEEAPELQGFDLQWMPGYDGDLWPTQRDAPIPLAPPRPGPVTLEEGHVVSRHIRPLPEPVDPGEGPVSVRVYDMEFYVGYTIAGAETSGRTDCRAEIVGADMEAAFAQLASALEELAARGGDEEEEFPLVGRDFSDEIRLTCG